MNDLLSIDFGSGATLKEVMMRPDAYPEELQAAYLDAISTVASQLKEAKQILEAHLLKKMQDENATKLIFKGIDGQELIATRKKGSVKCDIKNADEILKSHGHDPLSAGNYEYKPSWLKAKELRKLGGDIQIIIDDLFKEGREKIEIEQK